MLKENPLQQPWPTNYHFRPLLFLCPSSLKGTVSPDTGFSFRVHKVNPYLSLGPLIAFYYFYLVVPLNLKICFNADSLKTLTNDINFLGVLKINSCWFKGYRKPLVQ
jgi:hypothetical protein